MRAPNEKHIVVLIYWSLQDPLCEGLILDYLKRLGLNGYKYHLITFEQSKYKLTAEEVRLKQVELNQYGIFWHPLQYRSGSLFLVKKVFSFLEIIFLIRKLNKQHSFQLLVAVASIAGMMGFVASRINRLKFCQLTYEPHSEIVMGSGGLSKSSFKYKVSHWFEMLVGRKGEYIVCTSRHMVERLKKLNAKGKILRLPSCVNEDRNVFDEMERLRIRKSLEIENKHVLIYPGKFGGMYCKEFTLDFIAEYLRDEPNHHAIIITDFDLGIISDWADKFSINKSQLTLIPSVKLQEIPGYLSAADIGLIAYANFEARKYCSPVKTAEYLLCGLPYIVQRHTSEDDEYALKYGVGIVTETIDQAGCRSVKNEIGHMLNQDKSTLREKCRRVGLEYRSSSLAIRTIKNIFLEL